MPGVHCDAEHAMSQPPRMSGRIVKAPEGHLPVEQLEAARKARRRFMGQALALGAGAAGSGAAGRAFAAEAGAAAGAVSSSVAAPAGDPAILNLPEHSKALGQPAAGTPSATSSAARARA